MTNNYPNGYYWAVYTNKNTPFIVYFDGEYWSLHGEYWSLHGDLSFLETWQLEEEENIRIIGPVGECPYDFSE